MIYSKARAFLLIATVSALVPRGAARGEAASPAPAK